MDVPVYCINKSVAIAAFESSQHIIIGNVVQQYHSNNTRQILIASGEPDKQVNNGINCTGTSY